MAASDGLAALPSSSPSPTLQLALLNAQGVALHLLGDVGAAHESLRLALDVALSTARRGSGDDDYTGIAGCLQRFHEFLHTAFSIGKGAAFLGVRAAGQ